MTRKYDKECPAPPSTQSRVRTTKAKAAPIGCCAVGVKTSKSRTPDHAACGCFRLAAVFMV